MSYRFEKLSVLIVEDTTPLRRLLMSVLTTMGIGTVYTAQDGERGFQAFCQHNPDIVITDWSMSPMNGIELIEKIRTDGASPNKMVPVILMTGYSAMPRVEQARDGGATEFLVKPFSATELARRIAYVINKPRDFVDTRGFFGPDRRRRRDSDYKGPRRRDDDTGA
jgi:CheY-like chemotaxis protein